MRARCSCLALPEHFFYKGIYEKIASGGDTAPAAAVTFPLHWLFGFFYDNGNYAVPVFWMISGFIFFWKVWCHDQ